LLRHASHAIVHSIQGDPMPRDLIAPPIAVAKPRLDATGRILMRAAKHIERHGWTQHSFRDDDGSICIQSAVLDVTGGRHRNADIPRVAVRALERLRRYLHAHDIKMLMQFAADRADIMTWNDAKGRTKGEVLAAL
jgi:hypothetical protein